MLTKIGKIEEVISMAFLAAIVLFVFSAALMRSIGYPIIWSVDMAQLLFVWVCMLGANQALRRADHVGIDFLVRRLSRQNRLKLDVFIYALIALLLLVLVIFGIELTLLNPERILGTTNLPYALVTAAIPAGSALMLLTVFSKISGFIKAIKAQGEAND